MYVCKKFRCVLFRYVEVFSPLKHVSCLGETTEKEEIWRVLMRLIRVLYKEKEGWDKYWRNTERIKKGLLCWQLPAGSGQRDRRLCRHAHFTHIHPNPLQALIHVKRILSKKTLHVTYISRKTFLQLHIHTISYEWIKIPLCNLIK